MTALVVADTTVWCNFAHAGQPRLVSAAYPGVASPPQVLDEIAEGQRLGHLGDFDRRFIKRLPLTPAEASRAKDLEGSLGPGEAACLAVAAARGIVVLTDDLDARTVAGFPTVPVHRPRRSRVRHTAVYASVRRQALASDTK
jgi:predicted nucleic acid-binding protein